MTDKQKEYVNVERKAVFERDNYICQNCRESVMKYGTPQAAHRINSSDCNVKAHGVEVIYHRFNMKATCSLFCNSRFNINNKPAQKMELLIQIKADLEQREKEELKEMYALRSLIND